MPSYFVTFKPEHEHYTRIGTPEADGTGWVRVVAANIIVAQSIVESHYGEKWDDVLTARGMTDRAKARGVLPSGEFGVIDSEYDGAPDESYPGQRADLAAEAVQDERYFGNR